MTGTTGMPRPSLYGPAAPFWTAVRNGALHIQRCAACHAYRHPPRPVCAACGARAAEWVPSTGTGEVWTMTTIHPPTLAAFADLVPYAVVVVRLDEGVFLVSRLVECRPEAIEIGMRVRVVPTRVGDADDDVVLPLFAPE